MIQAPALWAAAFLGAEQALQSVLWRVVAAARQLVPWLVALSVRQQGL